MKNTNKTNEQLSDEVKKLNEKIIDLKNTELQQKQSDEQLAAIYQNAPFIMILVDSERRVRKVNGATLEFADSFEEDLMGLRGGEALRCLHHLDNHEIFL